MCWCVAECVHVYECMVVLLFKLVCGWVFCVSVLVRCCVGGCMTLHGYFGVGVGVGVCYV